MLRTQHPVKILGSANNFEIKDFQNRIKSQNRYQRIALHILLKLCLKIDLHISKWGNFMAQGCGEGAAKGSNQSILWFT